MNLFLAQLNPTIGDFAGNLEKVLGALDEARKAEAELVLFSELVLTGYPPEDFLHHDDFIQAADGALEKVIQASKGLNIVIGSLRKEQKKLYNTAFVISDQKLLGFQDKRLLPTYDVFDEARYFTPGKESRLFKIGNIQVAVTICEDLWFHSGLLKDIHYESDPVEEIKELKPDLVLNLSASPYHYNKIRDRLFVVAHAAKSIGAPIAHVNQVGGNDSLIFDGRSCLVNAQGELTALLPSFEESIFLADTEAPPIPFPKEEPLEELRKALVLGIRDYFYKSGFKKACLGLSGGIDSALVAVLAKEALGKEHLTLVAMPSPYSSEGSLTHAKELADKLEIPLLNIPINAPLTCFLDLLKPHFNGKAADATEENLQARLRGIILMALSNKHNYLVLSTGNKSELAMGYSTLYGDLAGGLAVIADLTKNKVYALSRHLKIIPKAILDKPPSAELRPDQKDSDTLPPYPIIDGVLTAYIEEGRSPEAIAKELDLPLELVLELIHKIHQSEYKRRQAPPGLRVTEKAFAVGRRFPIVQKFR